MRYSYGFHSTTSSSSLVVLLVVPEYHVPINLPEWSRQNDSRFKTGSYPTFKSFSSFTFPLSNVFYHQDGEGKKRRNFPALKF